MRLDERKGNLIHGGWLVRVLASSQQFHECDDCGGRMFVKARSGRCPVCFTHAQERVVEIDSIVAEEAGTALQDWLPSS